MRQVHGNDTGCVCGGTRPQTIEGLPGVLSAGDADKSDLELPFVVDVMYQSCDIGPCGTGCAQLSEAK